jgi:DnaJ-domain-containing protein 1
MAGVRVRPQVQQQYRARSKEVRAAHASWVNDSRWVRVQTGSTALTTNYYQLLGIRPTASQEELERAYKRYVFRIHPDRVYVNEVERTEAQRKLLEINNAMRVLRDPVERLKYTASLKR